MGIAYILCGKSTINSRKKRKYVCRIKNDLYLCTALREKHFLKEEFGEVAEWSIAAVLKTVVLRGTRGSNPCLSAIKGVNQAFARFTPFFTPKNVKLGVFVFFKILQKNVNYKAIGISMDWQNEPL